LRVGSTNTLLGSVTVPPGAGHAGVAPKEFFATIAIATFNGLNLQNNQSLQASCEATMTAGKTVVVTVVGGTF